MDIKLKQFIGKDIRGYMNFNIAFNESLTFLIGINGTGKTTILKLLSGLLCPSYIELCQIEFSYIELLCEKNGDREKKIKIECRKEGNVIILSFIDIFNRKNYKNKLPLVEFSNIRNNIAYETIENEKLNRALFDFENLEVVSKIKELRTPLFLGLNRRTGNNIMPLSGKERDIFFTSRHRNPNFDIYIDSVDSALRDIEDMFHNYVRQNAQSQYFLSEQFRKKVFSESFKIEKNTVPTIDYTTELEKLQLRREQLNDAIDKLDVTDLSKQFTEYFDSIEKTLYTLVKTPAIGSDNKPSEEYINVLLQWMILCSQVEKIDNIIGYANEYSQNIQKTKEPLLRFIDSVNIFFKEGHKEIEVTPRGDVKIKIKGTKKENSIYELSSGEKQLIILLAHIAFHKRNRNSSILIIDEPELSLHISWQELFVDALLKASPNTQYILATHAPAIISTIERRNNCVDLTLMNK